MNFLAHAALAGSDPDVVVGGFLGDFVKGPVPDELPPGVQRGIRLHRRVDAFSNSEPDIRQSVARFKPKLRRVAPVLVDILADHYLARSFETYYDEPLETFCTRTYAVLRSHERVLPNAARRFAQMVEETDLFGRYVNIDVVERAFRRVAERLGVLPVVPEALATLHRDYAALSGDFERYFPALKRHAADWLATPAGAGKPRR